MLTWIILQGGFSIEAGRRCESGAGVFIFLSKHGPQIFQSILKQCTREKTPPVQQLSVHRRSLSDQSLISLTTKTNQPAGPPVQSPADCVTDKDEESASHYSTVRDSPIQKLKQLSLLKPYFYNSKESVGDEDNDDDERCHSLDSLNLNATEQNIYCNFVRPTLPLVPTDQIKPEIEEPECIYAEVKIKNPPPNPRSTYSSPLPRPTTPPPPPCPPPQTVPLPKPRYQRQSPVNIQPGYNAQAQPVDDMKETEETINCSIHFAPTEAPGSFKHRLAEIISKDLAKFQPPLPPGASSPTFSQ